MQQITTPPSSIQDRRAPARRRLKSLVDVRNHVLAELTELAGERPFTADPKTLADLEDFCQSLVDYAAAAHFQLYRYVAERRERRSEVEVVAGSVYPEIAETTEAFLNFSDKYSGPEAVNHLDELEDDLSRIGELLDARITDEDRVIAVLQ